MKKIFNFSFVCMMIALSSCMFGLSSCGDDKDDAEGTDGIHNGTWLVTHIKITEDGQTLETDITPALGITYRLTLKNDSFEFYFKDEEESYTESGKWSYSDNILTLNSEDSGTEHIQVLSWTDTKLVTREEDEEDITEMTFTKQ
ncbi:lipocalin family protein [Parabacteroides sp.]